MDVIHAKATPALHELSVGAARELTRAAFVTRGDAPQLWRVHDHDIPTAFGTLVVRLYKPRAGRLPVVLFLRGGGWTVNDLDTHDELCRRLASRSGCIIASLNYRRAPEHKYPAALWDCYFGYRWLFDNPQALGYDTSNIAIAGESAGGALAAGLTLLLRDIRAPLPTYQALVYPAIDDVGRWPSYAERGSGYLLDRDQAEWFLQQYLPPRCSRRSPYLFPLRAQDMSGLPPTLVITAEFDPLRDEGRAYAKALSDAGVPVEYHHAADQMHGFMLLGRVVPRARALTDRVADRLAQHAAGPAPACR